MSPDAVVVTFESAEGLASCLDSVRGHTQVFVVDNASADRSAEIAEAAGAHVVRNADNRGFAAAANQGAALGRADLILFLNPDATLASGDLALLAGALDDPSVGAAGPRLVHPDGSEQRAWWPFPSPALTWREALGLERLRARRPAADGSVDFVVGACLLVRRDAFERLGGFDERFWLYGEEADLCRRLRESGLRVVHVPEARALHVGAASSAALGPAAFEHFQRGAELFVRKHHGPAGLVLHRAGLLVGSLLRLPALALRRGDHRLQTRRAVVARLLRELSRRPTEIAP
ncbi:MAG: glycosyltransferase family 2 protein [Gaiellaceae bacterium]